MNSKESPDVRGIVSLGRFWLFYMSTMTNYQSTMNLKEFVATLYISLAS